VVGEAGDGRSALEAARTHDPDLVLLDLALPDVDGVELAHRLAELDPGLGIVLVSSRDREEVEPLLDGAPVRGFIPKEELSAGALRALMG
jgi:DNA-binding NarL/FixJ family response regulator